MTKKAIKPGRKTRKTKEAPRLKKLRKALTDKRDKKSTVQTNPLDFTRQNYFTLVISNTTRKIKRVDYLNVSTHKKSEPGVTIRLFHPSRNYDDLMDYIKGVDFMLLDKVLMTSRHHQQQFRKFILQEVLPSGASANSEYRFYKEKRAIKGKKYPISIAKSLDYKLYKHSKISMDIGPHEEVYLTFYVKGVALNSEELRRKRNMKMAAIVIGGSFVAASAAISIIVQKNKRDKALSRYNIPRWLIEHTRNFYGFTTADMDMLMFPEEPKGTWDWLEKGMKQQVGHKREIMRSRNAKIMQDKLKIYVKKLRKHGKKNEARITRFKVALRKIDEYKKHTEIRKIVKL